MPQIFVFTQTPIRNHAEMSDTVSPNTFAANSGNDRSLFPIILVLTLLTAGAGALAGMNLVDQTRLAVLNTERVQAKTNVQPLYHTASYVQSIKPVVANLAEPKDVFLRVQGTVVFQRDAIEEASVLTSKIESDISAYIRTLNLADLEGAGGLQHLREDLNQRAKIRSKGKVSEFILETMVVQ